MKPPQKYRISSEGAALEHDPYACGGAATATTASWFLMAFAKQVETVAVGIYLYHQTGNALSLGWLGLIQALPFMLLAIRRGGS